MGSVNDDIITLLNIYYFWSDRINFLGVSYWEGLRRLWAEPNPFAPCSAPGHRASHASLSRVTVIILCGRPWVVGTRQQAARQAHWDSTSAYYVSPVVEFDSVVGLTDLGVVLDSYLFMHRRNHSLEVGGTILLFLPTFPFSSFSFHSPFPILLPSRIHSLPLSFLFSSSAETADVRTDITPCLMSEARRQGHITLVLRSLHFFRCNEGSFSTP